MQVAEKTDRAAIRTEARQHAHGIGLRDALRGHWVAVLVGRLEMAPVEKDVRQVLAAEHGIGLRPRRDQDRASRQRHLLRRLIRLGADDLARRGKHVGSRPCRRVTANGFSPGACRGRDNIAERRADVASMRAGLATTAAASVRRKICEPEVPLPIR